MYRGLSDLFQTEFSYIVLTTEEGKTDFTQLDAVTGAG